MTADLGCVLCVEVEDPDPERVRAEIQAAVDLTTVGAGTWIEESTPSMDPDHPDDEVAEIRCRFVGDTALRETVRRCLAGFGTVMWMWDQEADWVALE